MVKGKGVNIGGLVLVLTVSVWSSKWKFLWPYLRPQVLFLWGPLPVT